MNLKFGSRFRLAREPNRRVDRLGWIAGGNELSRGALRDGEAEHRATHYLLSRENRLVAPASQSILDAVGDAHRRRHDGGAKIEYCDGKAATRIAEVLLGLDAETNLHDDARPSEVANFSQSDLFVAPS